MKITLKQLNVFVAVARYNNVTKASTDISLTQSATSMSLTELEKQLGAPLFNRVGKRLLLNDYGQRVLPMAQRALAQALEIETSLSQAPESLSGQLNIGASTTISNYLVPQVIANMITANPNVHIDLIDGNTQQIMDELLAFNIDVGLIEGVCHHALIECHAWRKDRLRVFCAPDHPLANKKVTMDDLTKAAWVLREPGSGTRAVFEMAVYGKIEPLNVILELHRGEAIKQSVKVGIGIGCLSEMVLDSELRHGELVEIETPFLDLQRDLFILQHKKHYRSALVETFLDLCNDSCEESTNEE